MAGQLLWNEWCEFLDAAGGALMVLEFGLTLDDFSCGVHGGQDLGTPTRVASDHLPLVAELRVRRARAQLTWINRGNRQPDEDHAPGGAG